MNDVKAKIMKACGKCGENYEEKLDKCPRCGSTECYFWYKLKPDLWDNELEKEFNFTFSITISAAGDAKMFSERAPNWIA